MKTMKFKTNINCGGCVKGVTPTLNGSAAIKKWEVDLKSPDRTLTVQAEELTADEVRAVVADAGFQAEAVE